MNEPHNSNGNCYLRPDPSLFQIKKYQKSRMLIKICIQFGRRKHKKKVKAENSFYCLVVFGYADHIERNLFHVSVCIHVILS